MIMKKFLSCLLVAVMVIAAACSVVACDSGNGNKTNDKVTVKSIEVTDTSLSCFVGDNFDANSVNLKVTYSDGSSKSMTVSAAKATATAVDTSTAGEKTLTVTLDGKTATTKVTVKAKSEHGGDDPTQATFTYYSTSKLPEDKIIYVVNDTEHGYAYSSDQLFTAQAIQGLFARKETTFVIDSHYMTNGVNTDMYYLKQAAKTYDLTIQYITLEDAVAKYVSAWDANVADKTWGSDIPLENYTQKQFKAYVEGQSYSTPGYIVYKKGTISVNIAATLSGLTGFIPVEESDEQDYAAMGLTKKMDVNNVAFTYKWLFGVEGVMDELSTEGLIHQNYKDSTSATNQFLKDYGICNKFFHVYYDPDSSVSDAFKKNLHEFLSENVPIFGYTYSEDMDVAYFSKFGQFIVPTDYTCNLTFFSAAEFKGKTFTQPNDDTDLPAEQGKHYVAFVMSDGDNATYWQNTAPFATNYMNASGRENDTFPMTWSMTPSLSDLMPLVLDNVYNTQANDYDYFCAPVSGQGYINAGNFAAQEDGEYFADFCEKLDLYMGKADLSVVTVIGGNQNGDIYNVLKGYAGCNNVTGGIVYQGSKYFGGVRGGVVWINGKPFVGPRDSLWETTPAYIAARINTYEKDVTSIDGYSIINVHPWSHSYDDVRTIVGMLNDDVEVVSVDRIMKMMTDNIVDKSNTTEFRTPAKNGVSISESYLQQNPSLIPVDPLFNDFLLWEEDWTGSGVIYNSTDAACSNVGAMYKGNISIAGGTTATKTEFTLPDIANYWLSFNARCDALDASKTATFNVYMTVGGEKKTVMSGVTLHGVQGTETMSVKGDGWQCFAFPIKQYFPDYRGKTCLLEIEVAAGNGIRLDQVKFTDRSIDPAIDLSYVDVYGNRFGANTEDWMLGEQYKTSQYYWWDVIDRENLQPVNSIQIDCSDGGGDEKRNGNTNIWMAKNYVLPASGNVVIRFNVSSDNDTGAMIKIAMVVNGRYIVLYDWQTARGNKNNTNITINLSETYPDIDFNNAEVTVIFEARDGGNANGVGEACRLNSFDTFTE